MEVERFLVEGGQWRKIMKGWKNILPHRAVVETNSDGRL